MLTWLRSRVEKRNARLELEKYKRGYGYAAQALLLREKTPRQIEHEYKTGMVFDGRNSFDIGMRDATNHICAIVKVKAGIVDDRERGEDTLLG